METLLEYPDQWLTAEGSYRMKQRYENQPKAVHRISWFPQNSQKLHADYDRWSKLKLEVSASRHGVL